MLSQERESAYVGDEDPSEAGWSDEVPPQMEHWVSGAVVYCRYILRGVGWGGEYGVLWHASAAGAASSETTRPEFQHQAQFRPRPQSPRSTREKESK